jgi:hypothetical protein
VEQEEMEDEEENLNLPIKDEAGGSMEIEIIDEPPPKKMMIKQVMGDMREYHYLKTVKSIEELDQFRFEV